MSAKWPHSSWNMHYFQKFEGYLQVATSVKIGKKETVLFLNNWCTWEIATFRFYRNIDKTSDILQLPKFFQGLELRLLIGNFDIQISSMTFRNWRIVRNLYIFKSDAFYNLE